MSDETDMTSKSKPDTSDANPDEGDASSENGPEETADQTKTAGENDEGQPSAEGESSVFATPKSISTGPPNPFSNRSPPRIREPDGNPRPVLAPSRFGASPFASDSSRPSPLGKSRLLLRPSLLSQVANGVGDSASATTSAFGTPVPNPFLRTSVPGREPEEPITNGSVDSNHSKQDGISSSNLFSRTPSAESSSHPRVATSVTSSNTNPTFVFGQNIHERVLVAEPAEKPESSESKVESAANGESQTGLLFSSAATSQVTTSTKTLNESAQEYEAARAAKRRYDEVEIVTGEEEETNVLQVHCKLHFFDKGVWAERGRGHLRLNDKVVDQQMTSRVVMRCQGTLRIVLNSKIWPDMTLDRMSDKSIRMTGYDNGQIKIFLITASPKDADLLHSALEYRLANVRSIAASQAKREEEERDSGSKRRRESEEPQEEAGGV